MSDNKKKKKTAFSPQTSMRRRTEKKVKTEVNDRSASTNRRQPKSSSMKGEATPSKPKSEKSSKPKPQAKSKPAANKPATSNSVDKPKRRASSDAQRPKKSAAQGKPKHSGEKTKSKAKPKPRLGPPRANRVQTTSEVFPPPILVGTVTTEAGLANVTQKDCVADLVEVRLDALLHAGVSLAEIKKVLTRRKQRVLLTARSANEGGEYAWHKGERTKTLLELVAHTDAVDIELESLSKLSRVLNVLSKTDVQIILSVHSIQQPATNDQLRTWVHLFLERPAFCYKIATRLNRQAHLHQLVDVLLRNPHKRWALMGLGPDAERSREVLTGLGSALAYGYLDRPAAPGQPSAKQLAKKLKV